MALYSARNSVHGPFAACKLIPLGGAHYWPFASCRRYLPWFYSALLMRGRQPLMSLPVLPVESHRGQDHRGQATPVRKNLRSSL